MTPSHPRLMPLLVGALLCACLGVAPIQISLGTLPAAAQDNERKFEVPYGGSLGNETPVCWEGKRVGLVIGNDDYLGGKKGGANPLKAAVKDARLIHGSLIEAGFDPQDTELLVNGTRQSMLAALNRFYERSKGACVVFLYYAGHGYEFEGGNLLLPVDATSKNLEDDAVWLDRVLNKMQGTGAPVRVLVIDACRTAPGLGRSDDPKSADVDGLTYGTAILYSTSKGSTAKDGDENSIFSEELAREIVKTARIEDVFGRTAKNTRERSLRAYGKAQQPWFNSTLEGGALVLATHKQGCPAHQVLRGASCVDRCQSGQEWRDGVCEDARAYTLTVASDAKGPVKGGELGFRLIHDGKSPVTFLMGSPDGEPGHESDETQHKQTLARRFWMSETEVTQAQFKAVMGYNPSYHGSCGGDCPVEGVNWWEAAEFANRLSAREKKTACYILQGCQGTQVDGYDKSTWACKAVELVPTCTGYSLPTEARWEYAARAGSSGPTYGPLNDVSWNSNNSGGQTHPVGQKAANGFGLRDMLGNVLEWVDDAYGSYPSSNVADYAGPKTGDCRVYRGGSYRYDTGSVRAAERYRKSPGFRWDYLGFRLSRAVSP